jgi:hypothetical protein
MPIVYVVGPPNEDLVHSLRDPDPLLRAGAATALGARRDYFALPHLLVAARSDADGGVREAARVAILAIEALPPLEGVADRVVTAQPRTAPESVQGTRAEASAGTVDTFRAYVSAKRGEGAGSVISAIDDMHVAVIGYLEVWGRDSVTDLDEAELAATRAIKAIAEHINALSLHGHGAVKFLSYKAARERVATYDAARERCL